MPEEKQRKQGKRRGKPVGGQRAKDRPRAADWKLPVSKNELQSVQEEDVTIAEVRKASQDGVAVRGRRYFLRDGVLYCRAWNARPESESGVER